MCLNLWCGRGGPHLRRLHPRRVAGKRMRQPGRSAGADYSGVFADLLGMRRLRSVCLAETLVDDRALGSARGLRWLDVSSCPRVTETGILQVLMHCPELTGLDCSRCGEARGDMLGPHCPRGLRDLRLPKHAPGVACLESLLLGGRARRPRPRALRRLELEGCASGRGAWDARQRGLLRPGHPDSGDERLCPAASAELTDDHVGLLAASAPCLGALVIRRAERLTSASLKSLSEGIRTLTELEVSGSPCVDDEGVEHLAESLGGLRKLNLSSCPRLTDRALLAIAGGDPPEGEDPRKEGLAATLLRLNVSSCPTVGSGGLCEVLKRCSNLTCLAACGTRAADDAVACALSSCANLRELDLGSTRAQGVFVERQWVARCAEIGVNHACRWTVGSGWKVSEQPHDETPSQSALAARYLSRVCLPRPQAHFHDAVHGAFFRSEAWCGQVDVCID